MKQNDTLAWSNEFDEQNNCTKVYAHIINSNNESTLKVFIDEYSGYIDDDQSHDCFIAYIEKMQLLSGILNDVKDLYDKLDTIDRYHVVNEDEDDDAIYSRDMRAFTTAIQNNVLKFRGFDISILNIINGEQ